MGVLHFNKLQTFYFGRNIDHLLKKLIQHGIIAVVLVLFTVVMEAPYGLSDSLHQLQNDTENEQSYRTQLENFIMKPNSTSNLPEAYTEEELVENRNITAEQLHRLSIEQLEEVANEIKTNGDPLRILANATNENQAVAHDTLKSCVINPNLC
jgi:hypothetical protein